MSHITDIKLEIGDLGALKSACEELGLELREGQKKHRWYGAPGDCDHAIGIPNNKHAYEIGVIVAGKHYTLKYDLYSGGRGLAQHVGKGCRKLLQTYSKHVARKHARKLARKKGWRVEEKVEGTNIVITVGR